MALILIVEDDRSFSDALARTLRLEGYEVLTANNAEDGVQLGLENFPDVIIVDWMLKSEMHGGEVCRRIRAVCPGVKSIMISGHYEHILLAARYCKWAEAIIAKPFHKKEILDAVHAALSVAAVPERERFPRSHALRGNALLTTLCVAQTDAKY